jgi:hypothetical protein
VCAWEKNATILMAYHFPEIQPLLKGGKEKAEPKGSEYLHHNEETLSGNFKGEY